MTPEGKVKDEIKKWLRQHDAYFFMPIQTGYGAATLDFLICHRGRFIGLETKAPGKKASPRQLLVMNAIIEAGGEAYCADSLDSFIAQDGLYRWYDDAR
jgi:hypothetical protein